jgi:hypothetical protein
LDSKTSEKVCGLTRISAGSERLDRMSNENKAHVEGNVEVIREYLRSQFDGFQLTDKSEGSFGHLFTLTYAATYTRYILKVSGPRVSDLSNTPERIKRQLDLDNVAGKMRAMENGRYFPWRFGSQAY